LEAQLFKRLRKNPEKMIFMEILELSKLFFIQCMIASQSELSKMISTLFHPMSHQTAQK